MANLSLNDKPKPMFPAPAALDTWSAETWTDGIQIDQLRQLDKLSIETMHNTYELTVIDPNTAEVLIRGGEYFPEARSAYVSGASLRSSFIKLRGIYVGYNMELSVDGKLVITSRVRHIGRQCV